MSIMNQIDPNSPQGIYTFMTKSESKYELEILKSGITLKRIPRKSNTNKLRMDNQKIQIIKWFYVEVDRNAFFILEPLGEGDSTIRITNIVTGIIISEHFQPDKLY